MNSERKKELRDAYKNRVPQMGVVSLRCVATGDVFLGLAGDVPAEFNSLRAKLTGGIHPNRELQALWAAHGEAGFELTVAQELEVDDPNGDYRQDLETLRDILLEENPRAKKVWK